MVEQDIPVKSNGEKEFSWKKYSSKSNGENATVHIDVSKLNYRDEFVRDLAVYGQFFSLPVLERALNIKKALIKKHESLDSSLDEILSS